jgi:hypothetical protein
MMFREAFAGIGIDISAIDWSNRFQNAKPCMSGGMTQDWAQKHNEDSIYSGVWMASAAAFLRSNTIDIRPVNSVDLPYIIIQMEG